MTRTEEQRHRMRRRKLAAAVLLTPVASWGVLSGTAGVRARIRAAAEREPDGTAVGVTATESAGPS